MCLIRHGRVNLFGRMFAQKPSCGAQDSASIPHSSSLILEGRRGHAPRRNRRQTLLPRSTRAVFLLLLARDVQSKRSYVILPPTTIPSYTRHGFDEHCRALNAGNGVGGDRPDGRTLAHRPGDCIGPATVPAREVVVQMPVPRVRSGTATGSQSTGAGTDSRRTGRCVVDHARHRAFAHAVSAMTVPGTLRTRHSSSTARKHAVHSVVTSAGARPKLVPPPGSSASESCNPAADDFHFSGIRSVSHGSRLCR